MLIYILYKFLYKIYIRKPKGESMKENVKIFIDGGGTSTKVY